MHEPIKTFSVNIDGREYETHTGKLEIPNLPDGDYDVVITASGFVDEERVLTISGRDKEFEFHLVREAPNNFGLNWEEREMFPPVPFNPSSFGLHWGERQIKPPAPVIDSDFGLHWGENFIEVGVWPTTGG
jgi:hypothetical protein